MSAVDERRLRRSLNHRLATALDRSRHGDNVVVVVEKLAHIPHMIAELETGARDGDIVDRSNGRQSITMRGGGRIRFRPAANPHSLRGMDQVDIFLVDPRVATTTELEEAMQVACRAPSAIVRPGDQP